MSETKKRGAKREAGHEDGGALSKASSPEARLASAERALRQERRERAEEADVLGKMLKRLAKSEKRNQTVLAALRASEEKAFAAEDLVLALRSHVAKLEGELESQAGEPSGVEFTKKRTNARGQD